MALRYTEIKIPAFTKGKTQLSPNEIETTRNLASVRIHVERVIGTLRQKYSIVASTVPIPFMQSDENETTVFDKIVVSSALVNLCPSVVLAPEKHDEESSDGNN